MPIEVELPDGNVVEFPDGTDNATMERALAQYSRPVTTMPAVQAQVPRATDNMSGLERFGAGVGKSLVDTGLGFAQATVDQASRVAAIGDFVANSGIGNEGFRQGVRRANEIWRTPQRYFQKQAAERKAIDADLVSTPAGFAGNATGVLAQVVGPGLAARGSAAASAILPTTLRGNVLQGGILGSIQPAESEGERAVNAGVGAGGGLLGAAIPKVAGAVYRAGKGLLAPFTESGARDAAARVLREFAEDPARLATRAPSAIPGVQRTLAEETLDPGIAQLQRTVAAKSGAEFDSLARRNNAARVNAIRQFAREESDIASAEAARNAAVQADRQAAMQAGPVATDATRKAVQDAIEAAQGDPATQAGLTQIRGLLSRPDPADAAASIPEDRMFVLENVRKTIGDMLGGKYGGDNAAALRGSRSLIGVRDELNNEISSQVPAFGNYLNRFRQESVPINRMQIGQELLARSSSAIPDAATGLEVLTPAAFGRQARDLDLLAARATGFDKAKAANILHPQDMATIGAVNDDLARTAFAANAARGAGSDTFQKLMSDGDILGAVQGLGVSIPGAGAIKMLGSAGRDRVNRQLVQVLTDPSSAQEVLSKASAGDRRVIQGVLQAAGGDLGTALAVAASN